MSRQAFMPPNPMMHQNSSLMNQSVTTSHFGGANPNHSSLNMLKDVPNHDISVFHAIHSHNRVANRARTANTKQIKQSRTPVNATGDQQYQVVIPQASFNNTPVKLNKRPVSSLTYKSRGKNEGIAQKISSTYSGFLDQSVQHYNIKNPELNGVMEMKVRKQITENSSIQMLQQARSRTAMMQNNLLKDQNQRARPLSGLNRGSMKSVSNAPIESFDLLQQRLNEDYSMKTEINWQLAINGFVRNQAIATKMDFIRPVIQKNPNSNMYMSYTSIKRHSTNSIVSGGKRNNIQYYSPENNFKTTAMQISPTHVKQYVGKMSVVTQLQAYNKDVRVPLEKQIRQDQPGFFDNPYCFQQFQVATNNNQNQSNKNKKVKISDFVQDKFGQVYQNMPPPQIEQKTIKAVTLLGQEKTIKNSIETIDYNKGRIRKLNNGAVMVLHQKGFEPDISLQVVGSDPPNLKQRGTPAHKARPLTAARKTYKSRDRSAMMAIPEDFSQSNGFGGFSPLTTNKGNDTMLTPHSTSSMGYMNKTSTLNMPARIASREEPKRPINTKLSSKNGSRPKSAQRMAQKTVKNTSNSQVPLLQLHKNMAKNGSRQEMQEKNLLIQDSNSYNNNDDLVVLEMDEKL